jgi:hypothetical protein
VEWLDHVGSIGRWQFESDVTVSGPGVVRTVGWLWRETAETLVLVGNHAEHEGDIEPEMSNVHAILKRCITRRVTLRDPSRRK